MKLAAEPVFNVFLFIDGADDVIRAVGIVRHERDGSDARKLAFLQGAVAADLPNAKRFRVPDTFVRRDSTGEVRTREFGYAAFKTLVAENPALAMEMYEGAFAGIGAPANPLMCVTPVIDGVATVEGVVPL